MGCKVIAYDPYPNYKSASEHGIIYVDSLEKLLEDSDVVSLHCPLLDSTHHILNEHTIPLMRRGVVLVNSSRGGLIDTKALIKYAPPPLYLPQTGIDIEYRSLKSGHIGAVGLDGTHLIC